MSAGHVGVSDGEVEAVGDGFSHVVGVDEVEAVVEEYVFYGFGASAVFVCGFEEVVFAVGCGGEHCCEGVLCGVRGAAGEAVEYSVDEYGAEGGYAVACGEGGVVAVELLGAHYGDADALSGVAEGFGA